MYVCFLWQEGNSFPNVFPSSKPLPFQNSSKPRSPLLFKGVNKKKDKKVKSRKKPKVSISFSVNPVIPKPHTPLQWEAYDMKEIKSKIKYLKKSLKGLDIKFDSAKMGLIQYVLSCGDKDIGNLIERSLNEKISIREWGENAPSYGLEDELPWDSINVSVSKEFLKSEYEKIRTGEQTPWCEDGICYNCGACN